MAVLDPIANVAGPFFQGLAYALAGPEEGPRIAARRQEELLQNLFSAGFVNQPVETITPERNVIGSALQQLGLLSQPTPRPLTPLERAAVERGRIARELIESDIRDRAAKRSAADVLFDLQRRAKEQELKTGELLQSVLPERLSRQSRKEELDIKLLKERIKQLRRPENVIQDIENRIKLARSTNPFNAAVEAQRAIVESLSKSVRDTGDEQLLNMFYTAQDRLGKLIDLQNEYNARTESLLLGIEPPAVPSIRGIFGAEVPAANLESEIERLLMRPE